MKVYGDVFADGQSSFEIKTAEEIKAMDIKDAYNYFWQYTAGRRDMTERPEEGFNEVEINYYPTKYNQEEDYYKTQIKQVFFVRRFYNNLQNFALRRKEEDTQRTIIKIYEEDIYGNKNYILDEEFDGFIV